MNKIGFNELKTEATRHAGNSNNIALLNAINYSKDFEDLAAVARQAAGPDHESLAQWLKKSISKEVA